MPTPRRVLVVDDERFFREAIRDALSADGVECDLAESGEEALKLADDPRLGAVILDVRLPGMSGIEVLGRLRERRPSLRAIVLSAHTDQERVLEALRMGASDYLAKPLHEEELRLSVRRALESYAVESRWQSVRGRLHLLGARLADLDTRARAAAPEKVASEIAVPVAEALGEVLGAGRTSLLRIEAGLLRVAAATGVDLAAEQMEPSRPGQSVAGLAVAAGHAILIEDVTTDERSAGLSRPGRYRTPSAALAPLSWNGEVFGVLCATDRDGDPCFEDEDLALLRILALYVAPHLALRSAPVAEAPAPAAPDPAGSAPVHVSRNRETELVQAVCDAMTNEILPERLVDAALRSVAALLAAGPVSLHLIDNAAGELALEGQCDDAGVSDRVRLPRDRGLTGMVLQTGHLVAADRPDRDSRFDAAVDTAADGVIRPLLCMPMRVRGKVLGVARAFLAPGAEVSAATGEVLGSALSAAVRNLLLYGSLLESIEDVARARREARAGS